MSRVTILRKCVGKPFLRVSEWVWRGLPESARELKPVSAYGSLLNALIRVRSDRTQYHGTFFFRNRPELELIGRIANRKPQGAELKLTVLACSNGAEVYSILWKIRTLRPDLKLTVNAIDISSEIVEIARNGVYSLSENPLVHSEIFQRLTQSEIDEMFDREGDHVRIKPWIREGVNWAQGDANDPLLLERLGPQDIVVANKFLCHMTPPAAEVCLRNLSRLVATAGHLVVSGIDLDVRTKVAVDLGWTAVPDLLEEIHDGDPSIRQDWPWQYWGLEPIDRTRADYRIRYAAVFQLGHLN
jgi:SAM-dependent methyltransferase